MTASTKLPGGVPSPSFRLRARQIFPQFLNENTRLRAASAARWFGCFLLLLAGAGLSAQPVSDNNPQSVLGNNGTTATISNFSVPANNDRLLVAYAVNTSNQLSPTVTFGSSTMSVGPSKNQGGLRVTMYYLVLGSSGSATVASVTATGNNLTYIAATSFHNVDQNDPTDGETNTSITGTATSTTLAVNSSPLGLVCDAFGYFAASGATDITQDAGQTLLFKRADNTIGSFIRFASSTKAGASPSVTMNWTVVGTPTGGSGSHVGMNLRGVGSCPATGSIWYVDAAAASGGNGLSWTCAFQNLQDAIDAASSGHEIWVKTGTYLPTKDPFGSASPTDPRDKTFYLKDGVALYGGFDGTETLRAQRDWVANVTTLSGDIGTSGDNSDNCYHVVISVSDANTTVLDGFTASGGNANGSSNILLEGKPVFRYRGGGGYNISSSPTLGNCTFSNNNTSQRGAGLYNEASSSSVTNCLFSNNSAEYGGGVFNTESSPTYHLCTFSGNTATEDGGGMQNQTSTVVVLTNCIFVGNASLVSGGGFNIGTSATSASLTNCLFSGNSASAGGGIFNNSTAMTLKNCTFSGNVTTSTGGGMHFSNTNPTLTNCISWNNRSVGVTGSASSSMLISGSTPVITYSLLQNRNPSGTGNLNGIPNAAESNYPNFVTPLDPQNAPSTAGDFHVQSYTPVANVGTNTDAPSTDLFGNARPFGTTVDLGVHELQSANCSANGSIWYVDAAAASGGNGASWSCAFQNLQDAINAASSGHQIWVKAGTYLPTKDPSGNASPTDPRDKTFYLKNGVKIYGGFDGTETMFSERDWVANATILSGDFNGDDVGLTNNTENAYHVAITVFDANTTQLDGFTLKGGNANGGASSFITVEGIPIVRGYGGGLYNHGAAMLVQNCTFTNNSTPLNGGGVYSSSAAGNQVTNCLFTLNNANNGGGVFNTQSSPTFTNCTFSSNTATSSGGGMRNESSTAVMLTGCTFTGNSCGSSNGGGFYIGTSSTSASLTNCLLTGNSAGGSGGGLYNSVAAMTLTNCTVSGNKASGSGGGVTFLTTNPTVTNCLIWNNRQGTTTGSASANLFTSSSTPVITYSLIQNNNPSGTGNLNGIPNAATSNYPNFVTPLDPATAPSTAGDFHITNCSPVLNLGTNTGAPATDLFGNARPFGATVDLGVHELQSAAACPASGTIWYVDAAGSVCNTGTSWACAFQNVQDAIAVASAGHEIWVKTGTYLPTLENGGTGNRFKTFFLNKNVKIYGGFDGTETLLSERDWVANLTTLSGDLGTSGDNADNAYHVVTTSGLASTATLDGFTVSGGNANGTTIFANGGGAYNSGSSSLVFANCTFSNNSASIYGGGMYNTSSSPTLTNCTFSSNLADNGGGVYNTSSSPVLTNCTFSSNSASSGGGMSNTSSPSISLTGCTFSSNSAVTSGGGLYMVSSSSSFTNCIFTSNTTTFASGGGGGGVYVTNSSPTFNACEFIGNTSAYHGGGMFNISNSVPTITNCRFSGNSASFAGGGVYNGSSPAILTNCTLSGNRCGNPNGGGITNNTSNAVLTNCIIWNNRASTTTGSAGANMDNPTSTPVITYSLIQNWNPSGTGNLNGIPSAANSNFPGFVTPLDPATAPSTAGDFHISSNCSLTIDAGTNTGAPATDLFGNARPFATTVDMGVHELQSAAACAPAGTIWYVDAAGSVCNTGTSWACAFQNVQDAIAVASAGHEIWVKTGTYLPTLENGGTGDRFKTFLFNKNVKIYGGFDGTETLLSERDWVANLTTLSGDLGTSGDNADNAYHVVTTSGLASTATLDGFTISGGNANGASSFADGGGAYTSGASSLAFANCIFSNNSAGDDGGGMYNALSSSPTLTNCTFSGNTVSNSGGGMVNSSSSPMLTNCAFSGNSAGSGGGLYNVNASPTLTNCTFSGNSATSFGGGIQNNGSSSPTLTNCIFSGNSAGTGGGLSISDTGSPVLTNCTISGNRAGSVSGCGGIYTGSSNPVVLTNCIIWNNREGTTTGSATANLYSSPSTPTITYSLIQNHNPSGTGNLNGIPNAATSNYPDFTTPLDPATAPSTAGDFHIGNCSPVLNLGTNTGAPATDLFGNARPFATTVDMGVHELQIASTAPTTANAGSDQTVSVNSATITANTPVIGTGAWSLVSGSGTITTPGSPSTTITNLGAGANVFRWTISNAPCTPSTDDVQVTYSTPPVSLICPTNTTVGSCQTQSAVDLAFTNWLATVTASGGCDGALTNNNSGAPSACGGSVTVTFTYTSTCEPLTTSCQATFTVTAPASPTPVFANCTNNSVSLGCNPFNLPSCSGISSGGFGGAVTASNSCGSVPVTCNAGSVVINGCNRSQVFTFEATACGQTVTCTRTFNWTVVTPPAFNGTCGNQVINLGCNPVTLPSCDPNVTASNECGPITVVCQVGAIVVNGCNRSQTLTYVANASGCGMFSTCTKIYNWQVSTSPVVFNNCNNTIDLGCNPATLPTCSTLFQPAFGGVVTASNDCGNISAFGCLAGTITVNGCNRTQVFTLSATPACGPASSCTRTFTWSVDPTATLTCPTSTTVAAGQTQAAVDVAFSDWLADATFSGGCGAVLTNDNTGAPSACGGTTTVTFNLDLTCQTDQTCQRTFTVATSSAPILTCPTTQTVAANSNCQATLANFTGSATTSGGCGMLSFSQSPSTGTNLSLGNQTVTLTATDQSNNTGTCTFTVSVADQTTPSITCPATQTVSADNFGNYSLANFAAATTSSDNCGAPTESQNPSTGTTLTVGNHTVTMTATDAANNFATCTFTVQVQAGCAAPILTCPATQTVAANSNCQATLANFTGSATTSGGCGNVSFVQSPSAGTTLSLGNQTVTLTATDQSNNTGTCTFTVAVADQTAPSITCPATQTVSADNFGNYSLANFAAATTSSDNCGAPTESQNPTAGTTLTVGNHTVTMTATDAASNSTTCNFTVQVQAGCAAPILTCPTTQTVAANSNCQATLANFTGSATTSGGCGNVSFVQSPSAGTTLSLGNQIVTLTATDQSNNTGTCTFTVSVVDQTTPSITCPTNSTVAAGANCTATLANFASSATASDNCGTPTKTQSPTAGTSLSIGNQIVTLTATDAANNSTTCQFTVAVTDQTAPSITCPNDLTVQADGNGDYILANFAAATTSSDNCGAPTESQNPSAGTTLSIGNHTVTMTATDAANNSTTCQFSVEVESTCAINAQISAPADFCPTPGLTATLTASGSTQFLWLSGETTAEIEVAPTMTTTYFVTVSDGLGCTATASHTLIVKTLPPAAITAPSPVCFGDAVTLTASGGIAYEWNHDGSTDPSFTLTANSSFIYVVTVTGANGCTMWKSKNLIVKPLPTVEITGDNQICEGQQTKLSTSNFNCQFLWNTGATSANITVQPMTTTTYTVSVTNVNNCQNTASITVNQTGPCTCENDNLLENNGFEDGFAKWTRANLTLTTVAAEVHSGAKAIKICGSSGAGSQKKAALATQTWLLKFWAKQDGGTSTRTASIQYLGASNAVLLESSLVVETTDFTLHEIELTAPEGTKWVKVKFDKSLGTGCLFVDDFCLIQVVPPLPKLAGTQPPKADFSKFEIEKLDENSAAPSLEIFPNPTDNLLNFRSLDDLPLLGEVSVLNSLGQIVLRQQVNLLAGEQGLLSLENLPAGTYFLVLKNQNSGRAVLTFAVF